MLILHTEKEIQEKIKRHELDLEKLKYQLLKKVILSGNPIIAERIRANIRMWKIIREKDTRDRLNPNGGLNSIMFIGINPSDKSKLKRVWDDPFGKFFGKLLVESGIKPKKIWITHLYKKPTGGNRLLNDEEVKEGITELLEEISFVDPNIIVFLGKFVEDKLKDIIKGREIITIPHPSYLAKNNSVESRNKYLLSLKKLKKYE